MSDTPNHPADNNDQVEPKKPAFNIRMAAIIGLILTGVALWAYYQHPQQIGWTQTKNPAQRPPAPMVIPSPPLPTKAMKVETPKLMAALTSEQADKLKPMVTATAPTSEQSVKSEPAIAMEKVKPTIKPKSTSRPPLAQVVKPRYIIQLMGTHRLSHLQHYRHQQPEQKKMHILRMRHNEKDWYLLAFGGYASYRKAQQALAKLPRDLQKLHPWIRSTKTIHQNIEIVGHH